jgi:hypothetical protein
MIVEFTKVLAQCEIKAGTPTEFSSEAVEPHIINGIRYNWVMRSESMKVKETLREWIERKETEITGRLKKMGVDIDGLVIFDWEPCVPMMQIDENGKIYNMIGEDGCKNQHGAGIIRYSYLDKTKKL